jgi:hypothetical protein
MNDTQSDLLKLESKKAIDRNYDVNQQLTSMEEGFTGVKSVVLSVPSLGN